MQSRPYQCQLCSDTGFNWTLDNGVRHCECKAQARRQRLYELDAAGATLRAYTVRETAHA